MISRRNKLQLSLFGPSDGAPATRSWTIVSYTIDGQGLPAAEAIRPIVKALSQALDNVGARRDPKMRDSSFDLYSCHDASRYLLAVPEDLHPAVAGMVERKLLEVRGFDGLRRGVPDLGREYRPAGFYEAGAVWVLATPADALKRARTAAGNQLAFDY
ncbi:MAG: hypothetical protein P4L33_22725 [Capsulimonadaceae bacterium]|nr:hypothetical protein [Capsulimonadaceae bacterium]